MRKIIASLLVAALLVLVANQLSPAYAGSPPPLITPVPTITYIPLDFSVTIPDANLRHQLHLKTGVPESENIYVSDLAALNGVLKLDHQSIADADGLQYCKNITSLNLSGNSLSTLPAGMGNLTALETLYLSDNAFTTLPAGLFAMTNLSTLRLDGNPLTEVPAGITALTKLKDLWLNGCALTAFPSALLGMGLKSLDLSENQIKSLPSGINTLTFLEGLYVKNAGLTALPDNLYKMSALRYLNVSDNDISSLSASISGMTSLAQLNVSGNKLQSLPDALCSLPQLFVISANDNRLYSLPSKIGNSTVTTLLVARNRIGALPNSIGQSSMLETLDVSVNRLTALPSNLDDRAFVEINLEWNFLDVSAGSDARKIINDVNADYILFTHQFKPIAEVRAEAGADFVSLSWDAGEDGADGVAEWEVTGYVVYVMEEGEMVELSTLPENTLAYTHTGLDPETEYEYRVGVDYSVVMPYYETENRCYTSATIKTLASKTPPTESSHWGTDSPSPSETEPQETVPAESKGGKGGLPLWSVILLCALGAAALGAGVTLLVLKLAKHKKKL